MSTPKDDAAGIRQTVRALRRAGYRLVNVYDGVSWYQVRTETDALFEILGVDDATLTVEDLRHAGTPQEWVRFVLGNDPAEVVADYTVGLSPVLDRLIDSWIAP